MTNEYKQKLRIFLISCGNYPQSSHIFIPYPFFVPPVYDLLQPQGFFKIEEENISSINRNIRQLENDKAYAALSAEFARTIRLAEDILATAKAQLKEAKTAREQRRKEKELNAHASLKASWIF